MTFAVFQVKFYHRRLRIAAAAAYELRNHPHCLNTVVDQRIAVEVKPGAGDAQTRADEGKNAEKKEVKIVFEERGHGVFIIT